MHDRQQQEFSPNTPTPTYKFFLNEAE
jgi:hypothetical protein